MKGAIIYKSRYGATRKYAEMLSEELDIPVFESDEVNARVIARFDYLVIGSSIYIGKLLLSSFLKTYSRELKHKKIFLFIVSADSAVDSAGQKHIISKNVPEIILPNTEWVFLRGKLLYNELSIKDKILLRIGAMMQNTPDRKQLMMMDFDEVKKENITALSVEIRKLMKTSGTTKYLEMV